MTHQDKPVYIIRYWATKGIIETYKWELHGIATDTCKNYIFTLYPGTEVIDCLRNNFFAWTAEEAIARVESLRDAKIKSLEKQLQKMKDKKIAVVKSAN